MIPYKLFGNEQRKVIDDILNPQKFKRLRILGSAGTGKTTIIAYCVKELLSRNLKVAVMYYNKTLKNRIIDILGNNIPNQRNLCLEHYHRFEENRKEEIEQLLNKIKEKKEITLNTPLDYSVYSSKGRRTVKSRPFKNLSFDIIIVDEGQDISEEAFSCLFLFLRKEGKFVVFADKYQKIYSNNQFESEENAANFIAPKLPAGSGFRGPWRRLRTTYRPNNIIQKCGAEYYHKCLSKRYGDEPYNPNPHSLSFFERNSTIDYYPDCDIAGDHNKWKTILDLIQKHHFDLNNTVVIMQYRKDIDDFCQYLRAKNISVTQGCSKNKDDDLYKRNFRMTLPGLKVITIHSFKGFEAENVIYIFSFDRFPGTDKNAEEANYIALTRATKHLVIIREKEEENKEEIATFDSVYNQYRRSPITIPLTISSKTTQSRSVYE